jgi:hypothetical protein
MEPTTAICWMYLLDAPGYPAGVHSAGTRAETFNAAWRAKMQFYRRPHCCTAACTSLHWYLIHVSVPDVDITTVGHTLRLPLLQLSTTLPT